MAPLPPGVTGHFGPELRRFVLAQSHQGQVTVPRLVAQLRAIGVSIPKRQVMRLLIAGQDAFHTEARDVLRAGLQTAGWITVDDTGARHKAINGFCTQIGNDNFAWFGTTSSKSRLSSLALLRAGHTDYVINDAALASMHRLCQSRPPATAAACHQGRIADRARPSRYPAAHQWLGERHPMPGHQTQGQRGNPQRRGPRLPRRLSRIGQDLRQAGDRILGLSRQPAGHPRSSDGPQLGRPYPVPRPASITLRESSHLSDRSKNVGEERLLLQHLLEALHQRMAPVPAPPRPR